MPNISSDRKSEITNNFNFYIQKGCLENVRDISSSERLESCSSEREGEFIEYCI